jgi:hypothetical protein
VGAVSQALESSVADALDLADRQPLGTKAVELSLADCPEKPHQRTWPDVAVTFIYLGYRCWRVITQAPSEFRVTVDQSNNSKCVIPE